MSGIPVLKPREAVSILQRLGLQEIRQSGSRKQFRHTDGQCTTVGSPTNWLGLQTDLPEPFHLSIYAEKVDIFDNRLNTAIPIS